MDKKTQIRLNIIQWNAQSLCPKLVALESLLTHEKIHIAALSETWLEPGSYCKMSGYNMYRSDRADGYGGVAILTHSSVKAQLYRLHGCNPQIELVCIQIFNCQDIEYVVSIYCPPNIQTDQNDWDTLFSKFSNKTLLLGDYNGHHGNWSTKTNRRGSNIFDALLDSQFIILNNGMPTRVRMVNNTCQQSSPDISLATSDIALKFEWKVTNESLGSDHLVIGISSQIRVSSNNIIRRNFKKADWAAYNELLLKLYGQFEVSDNLQKCYNLFIEYINLAADIYIPIVKINQNPSSKFVSKPYWNSELSKCVAERRKALANFRRNPTPHHHDILQNKIRVAQKSIRNAKSTAWKSFCSSLSETTSPSVVWQKMKWLKGQRACRDHVNEIRAVQLLRSLTPDFARPDDPVFMSRNYNLECRITAQEFEKAIRCKDTAPGIDNICYSMIKKLPENGKQILLYLFNQFYLYGFVPKQWRIVNIVPIPKPGRDPQSLSSLRPISMISCLCKIFHTILMNRLEWFIEKHDLFGSETTGFRKCRSTLDNLANLVLTVQFGFTKNESTIGCFIDINDAYNNIDVISLVHIMDQLGLGSKVCTYVWNYLKERNLTINNFSVCRKTGRGLAQGDPLSPLLFNMATISICKSICNVNVSQYADDFVLYSTGNDAVNRLQQALNILSSLLSELGLEISESKSKVCIFKRGFRRESVDLKINGVSLPVVDNIKYLGLWLDRSLRWSKHINETKYKITRFINIFKILSGLRWGVHPKHMRRLYISLVRSRVDYASFFYDSAAQTHLSKLDKVQNIFMRLIGGFIKSTAIHIMENELYLPPLQIRRHYLAGKFWLASKSLNKNQITYLLEQLQSRCNSSYWGRKKKPLLLTVHEYLKDIPIHVTPLLEMFSMDTWVTNVDLSQNVYVKVDKIRKAKRFYGACSLNRTSTQLINLVYGNCYKIFTDGSKLGQSCGAAFFDPQINLSCKFKILGNISIMYAELIAIAEALSYIRSCGNGNYVIFSDSKSALQHVVRCTSKNRGTPIGYLILSSICSLKNKNKNVILQWIPAHVGLIENEKVDTLAKEALNEGVEITCNPYYSDIIYIVKNRCIQLWSEYFDERSLTRGIWYRTLQPHITRYPWIDQADMSRLDLITALRLRSGHIPLNSFAYLMGKVSSPNCSICNKVEDAYHVLMECVLNDTQRRQVFHKNNVDIGKCNSILAFPLTEEARRLYRLVNIVCCNRF
jgi:ribonuclease HI